MKKHAGLPRHAIRDRSALKDVIQELARKSPGGVKGLARQRLISRATLNRLLAKKLPMVTGRIAERLEQFVRDMLGEDGHQRFLAAMTPPGTMDVMRRYGRWAAWRSVEPWTRPGAFWERAQQDGTIHPVTGRAASRQARELFAGRLARRVGAEVPEFTEFQREMVRQRIDPARRNVAMLRILEPFLDAPESGWVEPSWEELPAKQRRTHVLAAIRREKWLLAERGTAEQRAELRAAGAVGLRTRVRRGQLPVRLSLQDVLDALPALQRANPAEHARVWAALRAVSPRRG